MGWVYPTPYVTGGGSGGGGRATVIDANYAATLDIDASRSPNGGSLIIQVGSLTGNITLSNPTNPTNRQKLEYVFIQDAIGGHTLTLGSKFRLPSSSSLSSPVNSANNPDFTAADAISILVIEYDELDDKWNVVAFVPGY